MTDSELWIAFKKKCKEFAVSKEMHDTWGRFAVVPQDAPAYYEISLSLDIQLAMLEAMGCGYSLTDGNFSCWSETNAGYAEIYDLPITALRKVVMEKQDD